MEIKDTLPLAIFLIAGGGLTCCLAEPLSRFYGQFKEDSWMGDIRCQRFNGYALMVVGVVWLGVILWKG